eukprot:4309052-Amphidinium_carterae.1
MYHSSSAGTIVKRSTAINMRDQRVFVDHLHQLPCVLTEEGQDGPKQIEPIDLEEQEPEPQEDSPLLHINSEFVAHVVSGEDHEKPSQAIGQAGCRQGKPRPPQGSRTVFACMFSCMQPYRSKISWPGLPVLLVTSCWLATRLLDQVTNLDRKRLRLQGECPN